jgi:CBS domain containing-hemolysin-like protein
MSYLAVIATTLILSAFFSGSEMAFLSTNKLMIELSRKRHPRFSNLTDVFFKNPGLFISTILVGNNVSLVVYGLYMAELIEPQIKYYITSDTTTLLIQTVFSTLVILLTAEFLPKIIFRINPSLSLTLFAIPLTFFYWLFYPVSKMTLAFSNFFIRKVLKSHNPPQKENIVIGRIDLNHLINEHQEKANTNDPLPEEVKFFKNALDFSSIKVRECSVPRTELEAVEIDDTLEELRDLFIETGFSKILVYRENIDNIVGYVHVSNLFKNPKKLRNIISPISVVPETMTANKLLEIFTKEHKTIALVVDEFGGTSGIVTLEDILEEIFGEIDDEHDTSDLIQKQIDEYTYHFSGRIEIDYINEKYDLQLPVSDNYETLAGWVLYHNESIPAPLEEIEVANFRIKILEASKSKIELIQITLNPDR